MTLATSPTLIRCDTKVMFKDKHTGKVLYRSIPEDRYRAVWWRVDLRPKDEPVATVHALDVVAWDHNMERVEVRVGVDASDWAKGVVCGERFLCCHPIILTLS